ncbi:MAG TPA: nucleotidyltransferase family protein [Vicinamibacterales bacterium]|nr:nucleotidyltransferase family protein [Vicinamibacterales bacterium]
MILAAGRSTRMGRPKALLPVDSAGVTFVEQLARALLAGGTADALVIGRPDDQALVDHVERMGTGVRFVANPRADSGGQLSSILAGLQAADRPGVKGILVVPIDLPLVSATTVAALLAAFGSAGMPIVRATFGGRHGHPVIFGRGVFDGLRHADPAAGAKAVLRAHEQSILNVELEDPGIVQEVDTPEEYARVFGRPL